MFDAHADALNSVKIVEKQSLWCCLRVGDGGWERESSPPFSSPRDALMEASLRTENKSSF